MKKILVANRGEIAIRIIRTCQEMGLPTVAVYSEADRNALHTRYADEAVFIGPSKASESYLNIEVIVDAAQKIGADLIHPGYGFLAENPNFAQAVEDSGMIFIGPKPKTLAIFGDKLSARRVARKAGLLVLPGPDQPITDLERDYTLSDDLSFPVLVKAAAGGGGKGIRLACSEDELIEVLNLAKQEAEAAFGDGTIYLEPLVQKARHIEVQILGDGKGKVLSFGERECSIQRRHQKLIEEAPAPNLLSSERECITESARALGEILSYRSLGTVEFLMDENKQFYFIEVNPRIQVEHPVTEMVTGYDLVREQIQLAISGELSIDQAEIQMSGAAIEARILAESPEDDFIPTTGEISYLKEPGGPGIRVDSALFQGMEISADYDSLLSKLIAWGDSRQAAIKKLRRGLKEYQIAGVKTDLRFLSQILDSHPYQVGRITTSFLDDFHPMDEIPEESVTRDAAIAAALHIHQIRNSAVQKNKGAESPWRQAARNEQVKAGN